MPIRPLSRSRRSRGALACALVLAIAPLSSAQESETRRLDNLRRGTPNDAWRSTYEPLPSQPTVIRGATVMTAAGAELSDADVFFADGRIESIGRNLSVPADTLAIEGGGRYVTPGLIDSHSHLGVSATPEVAAHFDNNETGMTTPEVWIEHSLWPQGPGFARAVAGGVTTAQLLPGSGDLIEGRSATVKLVPARTAQQMLFPESPWGLKMACGENPKRGDAYPTTRMGNVAGYRKAFIEAESYRRQWDDWLAKGEGDPPARDLGKETLAEALRGNILLQVHCYRADEMANVLELAREFGLKVRSFHHAVEAYKIRDLLAAHDVAASMWSDWWGGKMEMLDGIPENVALVASAGARAIVHSDSDLGIQILNQDAAKSLYAGLRAGLTLSRDEALRWVTANPAWALGIEERVGIIEPGKNADLVLWSADPFSIYALADMTFIDGALVYDRARDDRRFRSDFEIGILGSESSPEGGAR